METVRIRTPQSLLQLLPRLVGDAGAPSLAALPFTGGRSGMPMVVDLPRAGAGEAIARAIRAGAPLAEAIVLVVRLDAPLGTAELPLRDEVLEVAVALERQGIRTLELLALAPDAWGDYTHAEAARGPLAELDLLDDPAPGVPVPAALPGPPETADEAAVAAVLACAAALAPGELHAADASPIEALELAVELAPSVVAGRTALGVDPAKAVLLAIMLVGLPPHRDLAIELALDGVDAAAATLASLDDPEAVVGTAAAGRFMGVGPAPDAHRLADRLERWSAIARATPFELRAPVLVIVGFLQFFLGRGRTAGRCAELAMAIDPALTMAPLLRDIVDARGAPDWVLRPGSGGADAR